MNIVVAGAGQVGYAVAKQLSSENHDITLIDKNIDYLNTASGSLDVICYQGNSASLEVLKDASVDKADVFIAATSEDEVNMVSGIIAKKLGAKHTMARIRNPEYITSQEDMSTLLGISMVFNPDKLAAEEIARILQFPAVSRIEKFESSDLELFTYTILPGSKLAGLKLSDIGRAFASKILVCAVERDKNVYIPDGQFELREKDSITLIGNHHDLKKFFAHYKEYRKPVKNVMVVGGGRIAVYLHEILKEENINVTLVDQSRERCEYLSDILPNANIINAKGSDAVVLKEAAYNNTDALVTLTGNDENNIVLALYAGKHGIEKTIVKINEEQFVDLVNGSNIDTIVIPKALISQRIIRYVRSINNTQGSSIIESFYRLVDDKVEVMEFEVKDNADYVGIPLKEIGLKPNILLASIIRDRKSRIPNGNTSICIGDRVIVISLKGTVTDMDSLTK